MIRFLTSKSETTGSTARRMLLVAAAVSVIGSLVVLGTAVQNYMDMTVRQGADVTLWRMARWPGVWWFGWVLLAPFFFERNERR